jgi:predicted nucleic acid-binding protein
VLSALLDACVLFPSAQRDTLLDAAQAGLYQPRWSDEILAELARNLVADRESVSPEKAARLVAAMRRHFAEAEIGGFGELIPLMTNHPKDRHVLAAAVHAGANVLVTDNLRDFRPAALAPHGIVALSADEFLTQLFDSAPDQMTQLLIDQAAGYRAPAMTLGDLLGRLAVNAPVFVGRLMEDQL